MPGVRSRRRAAVAWQRALHTCGRPVHVDASATLLGPVPPIAWSNPRATVQGGRRSSVRREARPLTERIRRYEELPLRKDDYRDDADWTADEDTTRAVLESLTLRRHGPRGEDASLIAKPADLLERAGPQFIAAVRPEAAAIEARGAAAAAAAKAKNKRRKARRIAA